MTVRAVVVGSMVADLAFHVPTRPQPGEVIIATDFGRYRGGKGYNQAVALARLGAQVSMVGAVGADDFGDGFLQALEREGIDAGRVVQLRGISTAIAVPLITPDGDVGFVQYPGANRQIAPAHCAELPDCDVLLLQGEISSVTSEHAANVVRRRDGFTILNPAPVHDVSKAMLDAVDVIVPNQVEAAALLSDRDSEDHPEGLDAARALRTERRAAVVTLGAQGAAYAAEDQEGTVPAPSVHAVDSTGAGDAFCAGLAIALAEGAGYENAVRFACAAGAHAATVAGAEPGMPRREQVQRLLTAAR